MDGGTVQVVAHTEEQVAAIAAAIWSALDRIKDPCHLLSGHDLSIVDLGLINRVDLIGDQVEVGITFTDSTCLFAYRIIADLEDIVPKLHEIRSVKVIPEPFPLWDESRLSDKARALYAEKKTMFGFDAAGHTRGKTASSNGEEV